MATWVSPQSVLARERFGELVRDGMPEDVAWIKAHREFDLLDDEDL